MVRIPGLLKKTTGNVDDLLKGLTPNTMYDWKIATTDSANGLTAIGAYADSMGFNSRRINYRQ